MCCLRCYGNGITFGIMNTILIFNTWLSSHHQDAISVVIEKELVSDLQAADAYSLIIDELTDVSTKMTLAACVR